MLELTAVQTLIALPPLGCISAIGRFTNPFHPLIAPQPPPVNPAKTTPSKAPNSTSPIPGAPTLRRPAHLRHLRNPRIRQNPLNMRLNSPHYSIEDANADFFD